MTGCYRNHSFCCFISLRKSSFHFSYMRNETFIPHHSQPVFGCTKRWSCSFSLSLSLLCVRQTFETGCPVTDDHHWSFQWIHVCDCRRPLVLKQAGWVISFQQLPSLSISLIPFERGDFASPRHGSLFSRQCSSFPSHVEQKWLIVLNWVKLQNSKNKVRPPTGLLIQSLIIFMIISHSILSFLLLPLIFLHSLKTICFPILSPFTPRSIKNEKSEWVNECSMCVYCNYYSDYKCFYGYGTKH